MKKALAKLDETQSTVGVLLTKMGMVASDDSAVCQELLKESGVTLENTEIVVDVMTKLKAKAAALIQSW